jgi:putative glycosyltransferase
MLERVSGNLFYLAINLLSVHPIPRNLVTVRLMTRRYVRALTAHHDRELFLAGLWTMTGFSQLPVTIVKGDKRSSTYTFRRKIANFVRAVTSLSAKPLVHVFHLGTAILILSGAAAASIVIRWMLGGRALAGWPSLIVAVWFLGGVSIFFIGILGIYLARLFLEAKEWPPVIVREVRERAGDGR